MGIDNADSHLWYGIFVPAPKFMKAVLDYDTPVDENGNVDVDGENENFDIDDYYEKLWDFARREQNEIIDLKVAMPFQTTVTPHDMFQDKEFVMVGVKLATTFNCRGTPDIFLGEAIRNGPILFDKIMKELDTKSKQFWNDLFDGKKPDYVIIHGDCYCCT